MNTAGDARRRQRRAQERLAGVTDEIRQNGGEVLAVQAHLADPDAVDHLVVRTVQDFGGIDLGRV